MKSYIACLGVGCLLFVPFTQAGVFMFAESQEEPNIITHPTGYTGNESVLTVSVCIATDSESISELEIPVRNTITVWNELDPVIGNSNRFDPQLDLNQYDAESVLLHEVGHCIGIAHPNLASESNLSGSDRRFAKTLVGPNQQYDLDAGSDGVIGSREDIRGDDINMVWFRIGQNNPFLYAGTIDATTYSTDLANLPSGHEFAEIPGRQIHNLRGHPDGEAVMYQGIFNQETSRQIHPSDATMLRLGMSGLDRTQGTSDDYALELVYGGVDDTCDITVRMEGAGFGQCGISATYPAWPETSHLTITEAEITLGSTSNVNWFFNDELLDDSLIFHDRFE
jgi:hypothetical protein